MTLDTASHAPMISVTIVGPSHNESTTVQFPRNFTIADVLSLYNYQGSSIWVVAFRSPDRVDRLPEESTLDSLGIGDGDALYVEINALVASAGPDIVEYILATMASGIVGNAAYDGLKRGVLQIAERWRNTKQQQLTEAQAVSVAKIAVCIRFDIRTPSALEVIDASWQTVRDAGQDFLEWSLSIRPTATRIPLGVLIDITLRSPDPREARILFRSG